MKGKGLKFTIAGVVVVAALVYLVVSGMHGPNATTYYYEVREVLASGAPAGAADTDVRVSGKVVDGSVKWDSAARRLSFKMADNGSGKQTLKVIYPQAPPDAFKPGVQVVVQGRLNSEQVFMANTLLAKCPSKYEPKQ